MVRLVRESEEAADPVRFEKAVLQAYDDQSVDPLELILGPEQRAQAPPDAVAGFAATALDYLGLKTMMLRTHQAGMAFSWDIRAVRKTNADFIRDGMGCMAEYNTLCLMMLGREILQQLAGIPLTEAETLNNQADMFNQMGQYRFAMSFSSHALNLSPHFCLAWVNKGIAHKNLNEPNDALACYKQALASDACHKKAWGNMGNLYFIYGKKEDAKRCLDNALAIDPSYGYARRILEKVQSS